MVGEAEQPAEAEATADGAAAFAKKAKDLEALRTAVIDAAGVGAGLWLSYLFVLFYLAIAVGSVTHRNLLFESPVKLPFLNVDLPLVGFFVLGPAIFLIVHAYVLLHFVLLADKVGAFHAELQAQIFDEDARTRLRRQLPSNIFVQFLAGPREVRTGIMGFLLRLIAQIRLVAGPLALLVFFQLQFLPYHHEAISWWQRLAVVIDLGLLWMLWPSVARGETTRLQWCDFRRPKVAFWGLASLFPVLLVFTIATFPGEWLDANLPTLRFVPTQWSESWASVEWISPHKLLVGGDVDFVGRKPTSVWSNRLVLPEIGLTDHAGSDSGANTTAVAEPFSLRGRRLEGIVLIDAHLRKVDFTAAQLNAADLSRADLREAKFECAESKQEVGGAIPFALRAGVGSERCAELRWARLDDAKLQGALLAEAQLQGASLAGADLEGATLKRVGLQYASLDHAHFQGVSLDDAQLRGVLANGANFENASLAGANLQGASLTAAYFGGASLVRANLQGARLDGANLQGALLDDAQLQGASLYGAHLEGATLNHAKLQGARLPSADLSGAMLLGTQLQGVTGGARFEGAMSDRVFVWRAQAPFAGGKARIIEPNTAPTHRGEDCPSLRHVVAHDQDPCAWSMRSFEEVKRQIEEEVPEGERRDAALKQIEVLDPTKPLDEEEAMAKAWKELARSSAAPEVYVGALRQVGCDERGAPYVIRGLLRNLDQRFGSESQEVSEIAAAFLDEEQCAGASGLSEDDKAKLREIRDRHPLVSSGPAPTR